MLSTYFSFSQNQEDTIVFDRNLEEIIISAAKTSKSIDKLPIPIMIISEKEIKEFGSSKLYDVIKRQTGIVSVTTKTGTEGLQMQGLDASNTTILLDGFPIIVRSFGALDLNRISLVDIEKIEVIKGASSSLYGSDALGGVINLVSKKKINDGISTILSLKDATHNTTNASLINQYKKGSLQLSNSIDYYTSDGYDLIHSDKLNTVNPFFNYSISSNLKYDISDKFLLNTNARFYKQKQVNTSENEIQY